MCCATSRTNTALPTTLTLSADSHCSRVDSSPQSRVDDGVVDEDVDAREPLESPHTRDDRCVVADVGRDERARRRARPPRPRRAPRPVRRPRPRRRPQQRGGDRAPIREFPPVTIATASESSATRPRAGEDKVLVDVDGDDGGHRGQRTMLTAPYGASVQASSMIHLPTSFRPPSTRRTRTS